MCTEDGCPAAAQVHQLKNRYGIESLAWVDDRGMLTQARIESLLRAADLDWISSLRAPQIRALVEQQGRFQASLFDERNLLELRNAEQYSGTGAHCIDQKSDQCRSLYRLCSIKGFRLPPDVYARIGSWNSSQPAPPYRLG